MRRKQKRLLQFVGLAVVALLFLPNVGLWSLYRDRVFDNSPDTLDGPGGIPLVQVRIRVQFGGAVSCFLCCYSDRSAEDCEPLTARNAAGFVSVYIPTLRGCA